MNINNLLSQLNISGRRELVYLSITPGVGLELIELDISTKSVKNYAFRPLEYKESLREIQDMDSFKTCVSELFEELKLNIKSDVVINLPMVYFGVKQLPILLNDEAVTEALISEVEQSYIFKRYEPNVSWADVSNAEVSGDMRKIFYTAIQQNTIDDIKNALTELGANLVRVEISLTSLLKGLAFSGQINEQIKDGVSWNLMIINQNGYSICSMVGKNIIDYYEEPLAIKSFENDEIYNAINASAQIALMSYPASYLYIVSETDLVSSEVLAAQLKTDGEVDFYENNDFKKQDVIPVSLNVLEESAHRISLEAIGLASGNITEFPVVFNFLNNRSGFKDNPDELVNVKIGNFDFNISPNSARTISIILASVILLPALLLTLFVPIVVNKKQAKLDDINQKYANVENEVSNFENQQNRYQDFDVNSEIKKVLSSNRTKLMGYIALGDSVPKNLWLTYFTAQGDGKFNIKGEASNVEDVYAFYKNMKDSLINVRLRLNKLEMNGDSVDNTINAPGLVNYEFELTNMQNTNSNQVDNNVSGQPNPINQPVDNVQNENEGIEKPLNKPLLNFKNKNTNTNIPELE